MIEIVSIHIPKTAGTSFFQVLQQQYGEEASLQWKRKDIQEIRNKNILAKNAVNENIKALHGHFTVSEIKGIAEEYQPKIIVWLRDPVERVLSNYYFFQQRIRSGLTKPNKSHRSDEPVLEYCRHPKTRNRMNYFLEGIDLNDLFFIGIYERFDEDLAILGQKLGWGYIDKIEQNRLAIDKGSLPLITESDRDIIRSLNQQDVEIYEAALQLRSLNQGDL